jgi:hypothetical protein
VAGGVALETAQSKQGVCRIAACLREGGGVLHNDMAWYAMTQNKWCVGFCKPRANKSRTKEGKNNMTPVGEHRKLGNPPIAPGQMPVRVYL